MRPIGTAQLIHVKPAGCGIDLRQKQFPVDAHSFIHGPVHGDRAVRREGAVENNYRNIPDSRHAAGKLNAFLRQSAQELFARILAAECERFVQGFGDARDELGRAAVVRNGYQPRRDIETGIGPVSVRVPKVRSRNGEAAVFHSCIVPRYVRRARVVGREAVWRYLYGLWCCDLNQVLVALLGSRGAHLVGAIPESMRSAWVGECIGRRSTPIGRYPVAIWAECITPDPGWKSAPGSMLAVLGADANGVLNLLALDYGLADTHSRWMAVVGGLLSRGMQMPVRVDDTAAASGFSMALVMHTPELTRRSA